MYWASSLLIKIQIVELHGLLDSFHLCSGKVMYIVDCHEALLANASLCHRHKKM